MIYLYLIMIGTITFIIYGLDKFFSIKKMFRISEKILFMLSIMGGFLGAIIGMNLFHHKTKKNKFKIINILSAILWIFILFNQ